MSVCGNASLVLCLCSLAPHPSPGFSGPPVLLQTEEMACPTSVLHEHIPGTFVALPSPCLLLVSSVPVFPLDPKFSES